MSRLISLIAFLAALGASAFGSTTLRLHSVAGSVSGYQALTKSLGPVGVGVVTSVTNTTAGGTSIQATQTGGGTALAWMSEPFSGSATLSGTETCNVYAKEAAVGNNATIQCQLFKYSGGSLGSVFCTATLSTELTTSMVTNAPTCTATSTAFAAGDKLVIKIFIVNCATNGCPSGTMGAGTPGVTIDYDGHTASSDGDSNVVLAETFTLDPNGGSGGTPSLVQVVMNHDNQGKIICTDNCTQATDTLSVNFPNGTGAGNMITVETGLDNVARPTISDDKSNTYYVAGDCVDATNGEKVVLWYAPNVASGTKQVTLTYVGNTSNGGYPDIAEWTNVATAAPLDVSTCNAANATSITAGSVTPTYSGDLVNQFSWNDWTTAANEHYTAGSQSNITWAKYSDGWFYAMGAQWGVYASTAAINPTMTVSTSGFDTVAAFFRSSVAGTAPSGARVVAMQNVATVSADSSPLTTYFPCPATANLIHAGYAAGNTDMTAVSDSHSNTWTSNHAKTCQSTVACIHTYSARNATVSPDQNITLTWSAVTADSTHLFCITGAATAPFDSAVVNQGNQGTAGNLTIFNGTVTPSTSNGVVVVTGSQANNTTTGFTNASFSYVGCLANKEQLSSNGCAANNPWGIYNNPNTSAETWTTTETSGSLAIGDWVAEADIYKAPASGSYVPNVWVIQP